MRAWAVSKPARIDSGPLQEVERERPRPQDGEILVKVSTCGVCRTDLHVAEGDLAIRRAGVIPGHEIVGIVESRGKGAVRFSIGERVGIPWLNSTCGVCRYCRNDCENLCLDPKFTGWDTDGGYAEFAVVNEEFAYSIPECFDDFTAAPLLCAGIIGYRALQRAELPAGGRLGIWGFGGSAHLTAQIALARGATVHVMTRSEDARHLALELGATSAGRADNHPPELLDSGIVFAPAGELVPTALETIGRGGTLAIAGIHMSEIPPLDYQLHLFYERNLRSVTANTRADGEAFLAEAAEIGIHVETVKYSFHKAFDALSDLANDRFSGAAVLDLADI